MYILTFPAFTAHFEKGRGELPPNMAVVAKESHSHTFRMIVLCSCFFLCIFSKHFSCIFAALQNNLCGGTGCYQGPPSKPYLVLASHGRKIRSFCACALPLWPLSSLPNEFVMRHSSNFWQFLKKSLYIYMLSTMKWKHCAWLPNVYSKWAPWQYMVFDERSNWGMGG